MVLCYSSPSRLIQVPYTAKGTFNLRILRCIDYPELSNWAQFHHKGPCKREAGGSDSVKKEKGSRGQRIEEDTLLAVKKRMGP